MKNTRRTKGNAIIAVGAVIFFTCLFWPVVFFSSSDRHPHAMTGMLYQMLAGFLLICIGEKIKKKQAKRPVRTSGVVQCAECRKELRREDACRIADELYCSSCAARLQEEPQEDEAPPDEAAQPQCDVCGVRFPQSALHAVNGKRMCERCFQKEFAVDL